MNRLLVVLALASTVLLAGVLYELHGLNRRIDAAGVATYGALRGVANGISVPVVAETETERRERKVREIEAQSEEFKYILNRLSGVTPAPKTIRK